jgi:hypothetical protein
MRAGYFGALLAALGGAELAATSVRAGRQPELIATITAAVVHFAIELS